MQYDTTDPALPREARYFPLADGRYEVKPGLMKFATPFGNGDADARAFQIDRSFPRYRRAKLAARAEAIDKYVLAHDYDVRVARVVTRFIIERLCGESPNLFAAGRDGNRATLNCRLTAETLLFDADWRLAGVRGADAVAPPYRSAFDALACQVQEDLAVMSRTGEVHAQPPDGRMQRPRHWLSALHLCSPNHWSGGDKIGRDFAAVHAPVAGIGPINRRADVMVDAMVRAEAGLVRFAWGLATDDRLNHHPDPPPGNSPDAWRGRVFNPREPRPFLRIERQTIWGFPHATGDSRQTDASLFTIRTYFMDGDEVRRDPARRAALIAAIESMSPESLIYKGVAPYRDALIAWLTSTV
jgi:Haem-dependent oxidative N-demethylase, alpha subunit-like